MKEKLRTLFQQKFNPKDYRKTVLENLLHAQQLLNEPQFLEETNDGDRIYGLGYLTDADGKQIGLYYTDVVSGDVRRKRVGFRQMMKSYVKYGADAAIAVFTDKEHWRLSYMSDLKGGETSAKRFSYILGDPNGQYNTPVNRLAQLGTQAPRLRLKDIFEAFSVETLSKEFFEKYHQHYDHIVDELANQGKIGAQYHDYVKKMMGRIIFLHFLQKKGWLNGNQYFLRDLYFMSPYQADFLEQVLEPLFFGIFNTETVQRERLFTDEHWDKNLLAEWKALPYLNGGLFERDEVDNLHIKLPASLFEDLFTFLASYNFTVDENDPDDAEVGVDPEMLGKIFESLLEDNKAKGAFYTPKEIVRYMCKESLIAYLDSKLQPSDITDNVPKGHNLNNPTQENEKLSQCGDNNNREKCVSETRDLKTVIRTFVEHHEMQPELEPYRDTLDSALRNVKICDPAIGSGAFPMGLLNELWRCREALEPSVVSQVTDHRSQLKKQIIENNIYGVDIERGAIDIARLRFWLSIVVDAEEPEPLPNFDYKFMQGNSLIESYKGIDLSRISNRLRGGQSKSTQLLLGLDSDFSKKNLQRLMRDYFSVTDHKQKASMRQAINDEVKRLITVFIGGDDSDLNRLDPSANQDFFLWHTWFKDIFDNGGFDIVIGNPPYIQLQADGGKLGNLYKNCGFETFARTGDIYSLFYEQGWNLLNKNGHLCFITSNKWMRAGYGESTRKFFASKTNPLILLDLGANVFENATVDTNILLFSKTSNTGKTKCATFSRDGKNSLEKLSDFVQQQGTECEFKDSNSWVILSPIELSIKRKIESVGTPLKDWDINIYRGVLTGCNEAFIISTEKRNEILSNCTDDDERIRTEALIRPILRGRDIKRYSYEWANLWLIATFPSRHYDIEQYPAVKAHLESYYGGHGREVLAQTGATNIINGEKVKSRKKTNNKWFETQDSINYWEDFSQPKIIYPNMTKYMPFVFDDKMYLTNQKCFIITGKHVAYLTAFFNSSLFKYCFRESFPELQGGTRELSKIFFDKIPVYEISDIQNFQFQNAVEDIQNGYTKQKAQRIDSMLFDLYNLTTEERNVIGFVEIQ